MKEKKDFNTIPRDRFKYIVNGNAVIAMFTNEDEVTFKGIAKCAPGDTFNEEVGKEIAAARCEVKVFNWDCKQSLKYVKYFDRRAKFYLDKYCDAMEKYSSRLKDYKNSVSREEYLKTNC